MHLTRHQGPILIIKPYGKFLLPKLLLHLAHWPSCYNYFSFHRAEKEISFPSVWTNLALFLYDENENWLFFCRSYLSHIFLSCIKITFDQIGKNPVAITQHQLLHCIYLENCTLWWRFFRKFRCIYPMTLHTKIDICLNSTKNDQIFVIGPQCPSSPSFARCCKSAKNVIICSDGFWDNSIIVLLGKIKTTMFSCWFYTVGERLLASKR